MLKRIIKFEDFNGNQTEEIHYFNLTSTELIELEVGYSGGLEETIKSIVDAQDGGTLIAQFKKIILGAYGQKSPDGKRFIKNDQLREEFSQTAAYDALFMELATDETKGAEFINGILPRDIQEKAQQANLQNNMAAKLGTETPVVSTADLTQPQA